MTLSAFVLFLSSVLFFTAFGAELRDLLSPEVEYVMAAYRNPNEEDNRAYPSFPAEAVQEDESGTYVWVVEPSDEFPENAYIVRREDVTILHEKDGLVYVRYAGGSISGGIAVSWSGTLEDGMRVHAD